MADGCAPSALCHQPLPSAISHCHQPSAISHQPSAISHDMDPLTHAVVGRAVVAAARDEVHDRAAGAAAILGALSPDVDSAIAFAGWDRYVRAHQFGTHSIAGALVTALLAAALVAAIARGVRRWRARDDRPPLPPFTTLLD